ncbi:hypothetical protein RvVAT039_pl12990 (plasmid) [Agrobacterium vitis]|uniref:VOC family protein n=1 Tax=Agrobacterium vitis TaxID=373 RepID=UPI0015D9D709|nr:VOC family protein [Agrobacterium vitis]BCH68466.1 hypothetical protein RvVAT039_pl12990 [Agrobacterium vitis]
MPKLSFITWYSADARSLASFYEKLGIIFTEEQHGAGPIHFALQGESFAIELYPAKDGLAPSGADTLIGFKIADADEVSSIAETRELDIIEQVKTTAMGRRIILRDPDGRQVFLYSPTTQIS